MSWCIVDRDPVVNTISFIHQFTEQRAAGQNVHSADSFYNLYTETQVEWT